MACSISHVTLIPMGNSQAYYLAKLREDLSIKQRNNPHYSLRAYARDIGIHPATLSQIINGKRPLPLKDSASVAQKLNLGPKEKTLFMESLIRSKSTLDQIKLSDEDTRFILDESYYKVIAEWEHYALLELYDLKDFMGTPEEIATKLDLTLNRVEVVIKNLLTCGLLERDAEGNLQKAHARITTTEDIKSQALRDSHKEVLAMGANKLDEIAVELRDFSSLTMALDLNKLPEAKSIIREFRLKMIEMLEGGNRSDVYQLAIQFYPLTKIEDTVKH